MARRKDLLGGIGYTAEKAAVGLVSSLEGIWDYTSAGLAKLFGSDDWAEQQIATDWFGNWYSHPDQWFDASKGWRVAGDIAEGVGTSLPGLVAAAGAVAATAATGGTAAPVSAGVLKLVAGTTGAAVAGLGAAGRGTKKAYADTGELTGREFLYGGLTGLAEGGMEGISDAIGFGTGKIVKGVARSLSKQAAASVSHKVARTLGESFIGEAFEEGVQEILDPYFARLTYDPNAKDASPAEVAYASFVGGMCGLVMSGAAAGIDAGSSIARGSKIASQGKADEVMGLAKCLSDFEHANQTGDETYTRISDTYNALSESLPQSGGQITSVRQRRMLGDLGRLNTVAVVKPMILRSAAQIVHDADQVADRVNALGYRTPNGKRISVTPADLTRGVDISKPSTLASALQDNAILRNLAATDATGHLMLDTARFAEASLKGKALASQADLVRFAETATPSEIRAVSDALGIDDWASLDADAFNRKVATFVESGGLGAHADRRSLVDMARRLQSAGPLPDNVAALADGIRRFTAETGDIAVEKHGEQYRLYDYSTDLLSRKMRSAEMDSILASYKPRTQVQPSVADTADTADHADSSAAIGVTGGGADIVDAYAREHVPGYRTLSAPNKSMIRQVIRSARAAGFNDQDARMFAAVSARSGIDIRFSDRSNAGEDARYDPALNRITINPASTRSAERLLLHELDHAIRQFTGADGKRYTLLSRKAISSVPSEVRSRIARRYLDVSKSTDPARTLDEINAWFAEQALQNRHALERLVQDEPSLKGKILSFFAQRSAGHDQMARAARSYYKVYKRLFNRFAQKNAQSNAYQPLGDPPSDSGRYALNVDDAGDADVVNPHDAPFSSAEILRRGSPRPTGRSALTVGQIKKIVANRSKSKIYSRESAASVVRKLSGAASLSARDARTIVDLVWQILNEQPSLPYRQAVAYDASEYIVALMLSNAREPNPEAADARDALCYLGTGIGRLSFTREDLSEIRSVLDTDGLRRVLGRWGNKHRQARRYSMSQFVVDISREMPAMDALDGMHPVDAFLEIDRRYTQAKNALTGPNRWTYIEDSLSDTEIRAMVSSTAQEIMRAYDAAGETSSFASFAAAMRQELETARQKTDYWRSQCADSNVRYRKIGLLMDDAQKLKDLKVGAFGNSTQADNDLFRSTIGKLAAVRYRGNLNVAGTRRIFGDLRNWYTTDNPVLAYVDDANPGLYVQDVAEMLDEISDGAAKKGFSLAELDTMHKLMSYFAHFMQTYGKVLKSGQWVEARPEAEKYIRVIQDNRNIKTPLFDRLFVKYYKTFGDPLSLARHMDKYSRGIFTDTVEDLARCQVQAEIAEMRVREGYDRFFETHRKYRQRAETSQIDYRGAKLSKAQIIGLYMSLKRRQAQAGLLQNGFYVVNEKGRRVRVEGLVGDSSFDASTDLAAKKAAEEISELDRLLTPDDREIISIMEDGFNVECRQLKTTRDYQRLGYTNAIADYYYPIRRGDIAKRIDNYTAFDEYESFNRASFNRDTVRGAKQALFIDSAFTVFERHARAVSQYAYISPVVDTFSALFNLDCSGNPNRPVSVATESYNDWSRGKRAGDKHGGHAYLSRLIADVRGKPAADRSPALGALRSNWAKAQLAANPKVWVTQLSSLFAAGSMLDASSMARSALISSKDVDLYCPLARHRNKNNTAAYAQGLIEKAGRFSDALMRPIGAMDRLVVRRLFAACQAQAQKNGRGKVGTDANKRAAGRLLEDIILATQQSEFASGKSAASRSSNEILKTLTMFRSDAIKVMGRAIDGIGEVHTLKSKIRQTQDAAARAELRGQLVKARRKARKAVASLGAVSVFIAAVAELFRWLYAKDRDDDEDKTQTFLLRTASNLFDGLPIVTDVISKFTDGYDLDNYAYSVANDLLDIAAKLFSMAEASAQGTLDADDRNRAVKQLAMALGQATGMPVRNVYNLLVGLAKRVSPTTAYRLEDAFYRKNYKQDLEKAIAAGDDETTGHILGLILGKQLNGDMSQAVFDELLELAKDGHVVVPPGAPSDRDRPLSDLDREEFYAEYAHADQTLQRLICAADYKSMPADRRALAVKYIFDDAFDRALHAVGMADDDSRDARARRLVKDIVPTGALAVVYASTKDLGADAPGSSRRGRAIAAIRSLRGVKTGDKLLIIRSMGYALKADDIPGMTLVDEQQWLLRHILGLKITRTEKMAIAQMCGFTVTAGGKIITPTGNKR